MHDEVLTDGDAGKVVGNSHLGQPMEIVANVEAYPGCLQSLKLLVVKPTPMKPPEPRFSTVISK